MRLRLLLAYDGSAYSGWQVQSPSKAPHTVQGSLEKAFYDLSGQAVRVIASGRTDAGVHAYGQVAHVELSDSKPCHVDDWQYSLNCILPQDIRVLAAEKCPTSFHAGKNVLSKTYCYSFWQESAYVPPFLANQVWACGKLDLTLMRSALSHLLGEHDFASFQNAGTPLRCTTRTIFEIYIQEEEPCPYLPPHKPALKLYVTASGFLKQMVRNIAGLLCHIGKGKLQTSQIPAIMEAANRSALPSVTAPPWGLALISVKYKMECF